MASCSQFKVITRFLALMGCGSFRGEPAKSQILDARSVGGVRVK